MASTRRPVNRRLQDLFQKASEPLFVLDAARRVVFVNLAWEDLTGCAAAEALRVECRPTGPLAPDFVAALGGSFNPPPEALEGRPASVRTLIVHPNGERRYRQLEFWPLSDDRGQVIGLLGLVHDVSGPALAPEAPSQWLRTELMDIRDRLQERYGFDHLIGQGPAHGRLLEQIRAASASDVNVLVVGPPGTGKRLIARTIHQRGVHANAPLIPYACAALPPDVLAQELFGSPRDHPAGPPRLSAPEGASILLGDILDLPRDLQEHLAAALDGPVRLLATTTGDPERALADDRLRPDLYYCLTSLVIRLRPLRDRVDDIPLLAQHLLEKVNLRSERPRAGFSTEGLAALTGYDWPGNLRELVRVVEIAHARAQGDLIELDAIPAAIQGHLGAAYTPPVVVPVTPLDPMLEQVERRLIEQALQRARQNKSRAAELLAISRPRLYRRISELRIPELPESSDEPTPIGSRSAVPGN